MRSLGFIRDEKYGGLSSLITLSVRRLYNLFKQFSLLNSQPVQFFFKKSEE